jgi:hypothetical protein
MRLRERKWRRARGTEAFWIPAVIAAVGTGTMAVNQMNANSRQNDAETQAIDSAQQSRQQANDQVKALTQGIAQSSPQQIANQETSQFVNQLRTNEAGSTQGNSTSNPNTFGQSESSLPPIAGGSSRYKSGTAAAQKEDQQYGQTEAQQMGAIDGAIRQRQNEGLALNTLGTNLNLIGAQAASNGFVNQLRAQAAGQSSPWANLFGGLLQKGGATMAANGWGAQPGSNVWTYSDTSPDYISDLT